MSFNKDGELIDFGIDKERLLEVVNTGTPFLTNGCDGRTRENACNRPFSNSTPSQAAKGELRNFPFQPTPGDLKKIRKQLEFLYSDKIQSF